MAQPPRACAIFTSLVVKPEAKDCNLPWWFITVFRCHFLILLFPVDRAIYSPHSIVVPRHLLWSKSIYLSIYLSVYTIHTWNRPRNYNLFPCFAKFFQSHCFSTTSDQACVGQAGPLTALRTLRLFRVWRGIKWTWNLMGGFIWKVYW